VGGWLCVGVCVCVRLCVDTIYLSMSDDQLSWKTRGKGCVCGGWAGGDWVGWVGGGLHVGVCGGCVHVRAWVLRACACVCACVCGLACVLRGESPRV
jgi:hypothetical protein